MSSKTAFCNEEDVDGSDVEIVDGEDPTEDITQGLIQAAPSVKEQASQFLLEDRRVATTSQTSSFIHMISTISQRQRSVVLLGALHHGKTSVAAMLGSRDATTVPYKQRQDEIDRKISLKTNVATCVVSGAYFQKASMLVTCIDTPGHPDFIAEVAAGVRLADCALVCVDCVEGCLDYTTRMIELAALENLQIVLVFTKIDRLLMDLRLTPIDAYRRLRSIVDTVNNTIASTGRVKFVSPVHGSVCFSSSHLGLFFSLETFAQKYIDVFGHQHSAGTIAKKLWGPVTFDSSTKRFTKMNDDRSVPSFVSFVLDPIYKVVAHSITGKGNEALSSSLSASPRSPIEAAREAIRHFCGDPHLNACDAVVNVAPCSAQRLSDLTSRLNASSEALEIGALAISPLCRTQNESTQYAVVRVVSGSLTTGTDLFVVDEVAPADDYFVSRITELVLKTPEGFVPVQEAHAGQVVYALGLGKRAGGNLILFQPKSRPADKADASFRPLLHKALRTSLVVLPLHHDTPMFKVSVEPCVPSKLQQLNDGMQAIRRSSPGLDITTHDSGERTITGFGELQLDTVLFELRRVLCKGVRITPSQPHVPFCETVATSASEQGALACVGAPMHSMIGMTAASVEQQLAQQLEYGEIETSPKGQLQLWTTLRRDYHWDIVSARGILAFGPHQTKGSNVLVDDLIDEETTVTRDNRRSHLGAIVKGFQSATRSGPLCEEPMRNVKFMLTHVSAAEGREAALAMNSKAVVRQAFFGGRPRLMEPLYSVEILSAPSRVGIIRDLLRERRGALITEKGIPGTPLALLKGVLPVIDAPGFEVQLRLKTNGEAFGTMMFDHWDLVPGDPLDTSVRLSPLQPAKGSELARDFVLKTRFRKGFHSEITI